MTGLAIYGHLPTLARAIQFTEENIPEIRDWLTTVLGEEGTRWEMTQQHIQLETKEGDRDCPPDYWLVQDPDGGLHCISPVLMPRLYDLPGGLLAGAR